jgi:tRNA pseudouridine55 synthase
MTTTNGLLLIDKPGGLTSHDVVARLRRLYNERRIGHAGTLDPMATGLLVVAVGPSTRLLRFAQAQVKRYSGEVRLGLATDTLDADGVVISSAAVPVLSPDEVNSLAAAMLGHQLQVPPMVSALKVRGRRLHELAREGVEVERVPREILIESFALAPTGEPDRWRFDVTCSVGTYVRVLLSDLSARMGTVGHLTALRRLSSGAHRVDDAWSLQELSNMADATAALEPPARLVEGLESTTLDEVEAARMRVGQRLRLAQDFVAEEIAAFEHDGTLVGVLRRREDLWKPEIVMASGGGA